jgi:hypothetical protein
MMARVLEVERGGALPVSFYLFSNEKCVVGLCVLI